MTFRPPPTAAAGWPESAAAWAGPPGAAASPAASADFTSGPASRALLEVRDLRIHFPTDDGLVKAVDGVSFTLERGRTLGIVGESGSGKSVTSLGILGLHQGGRGQDRRADLAGRRRTGHR